MADHFSSSRLPTLKPVQPLGETNGNQMRQSSMAPPAGNPHKRKLQQPSVSVQPELKAAKTSGILGRSISSFSQGSNIARPASAAGRHGSTKSIDYGASRPRTAYGNRAPTRPQTAKGRPPTASDEAAEEKGEGSDMTISSRNSFSSRMSSIESSATLDTINERAASGSSSSSLINGLSKLTLNSRSVSKNVTTRIRSQRSTPNLLPPRVPDILLSPKTRKTSGTPRKSPLKLLTKSPIKPPEVFLTKDSNRPTGLGFDLDKRMATLTEMMTGSINSIRDTFTEGSVQKEKFSSAMESHKMKVIELENRCGTAEANYAALQREHSSLQQDYNDTRAAQSAALLRADEVRRELLNEFDDEKRRYRQDADETRRKHNDEIEDLQRETKRVREQASVASEDEIKQLERRHQAELDDLRRETSWTLEEERRERKREVQAAQAEAETRQRAAQSGDERHMRELEEKDERIAQLTNQVEREREIAEDVRKQLNRITEQNDEVENTARSLRARVEFLQSDNQSQSQAFADLEQRTQDALKQTEEYKSQLRKEESTRRKLLNQIQDLKGNIRVFCRVRPPLAHESGSCASIEYPDANEDAKGIEVRGPEETSSLGKDMTKTHPFNFDRAFGPGSENGEIFNELSELVAAVCGGSFNTCIFSYGQTGSGKTYTMASQDGMISRAVNQIFDTATDLLDKGWQYQVSGSFVEVYNENINDLLGRPEDFDKKKHEIRHDLQKQTTTITDVIETRLDSADHFGTVLNQALQNRSIAATKANERSSRSHSVCILRIEGQNKITGETCSSTLNLVDLAGSERLAHSQATGAQLKETQNINKSLSCLKDVIAALGDARDGSHVPYRNSKLTYLLQNSLGGNSKTLMFVMISPLQEHLSETLSSLNFATKVNNTRIVKKSKK